MNIVKPRVLVPVGQLDESVLKRLERYARVCYKSEKRITSDSHTGLLRRVISSGHESVIEHAICTVLFIIDRGVSHEMVRHRIGSYSQESTRFCNYQDQRFGHEITVVEPFYLVGTDAYQAWKEACESCERGYMRLLGAGLEPEEARSVLPNSLKTEIVTTYNMREWRHFFRLRCSPSAHPQMRQVTIPLFLLFRRSLPPLFSDIDYDLSFPEERYAEVVTTDALFGPV